MRWDFDAVWSEAVRGYVERLGTRGLTAALGVEVQWLAQVALAIGARANVTRRAVA